MNIIFTDIDGVLNPHWIKKWSKKSIDLYNSLCNEYDLKPVITSTWRIAHTKEQLQEIFKKQGIIIDIYDYTPILSGVDNFVERGKEIKKWLDNNKYSNYIVVDDKTSDIVPFVDNVIKCRSWIGFSEEEYEKATGILKV